MDRIVAYVDLRQQEAAADGAILELPARSPHIDKPGTGAMHLAIFEGGVLGLNLEAELPDELALAQQRAVDTEFLGSDGGQAFIFDWPSEWSRQSTINA